MEFVIDAVRGLQFRFAAPDELPLWKCVAADVGSIMRVPNMHNNPAFLEYAARKLEQNEAILAFNGETRSVAGVIGFSRRNNSITWLGVMEACRGNGVGSALLRLALSELDCRKIVMLNTYPESYAPGHTARRLYFQHGFSEQTGEVFLLDGLEMVTFVRSPR